MRLDSVFSQELVASVCLGVSMRQFATVVPIGIDYRCIRTNLNAQMHRIGLAHPEPFAVRRESKAFKGANKAFHTYKFGSPQPTSYRRELT